MAEPCAAVKEPLRKTGHAKIDSCNFSANHSSERTPIAVHPTCGGPLLMDTSGMRENGTPGSARPQRQTVVSLAATATRPTLAFFQGAAQSAKVRCHVTSPHETMQQAKGRWPLPRRWTITGTQSQLWLSSTEVSFTARVTFQYQRECSCKRNFLLDASPQQVWTPTRCGVLTTLSPPADASVDAPVPMIDRAANAEPAKYVSSTAQPSGGDGTARGSVSNCCWPRRCF